MLAPAAFYETLGRHKVRFFTGVPDSLLEDFCAYVTDHTPQHRHIIAANEGNAIALACGHHLATGEYGLVYLQNSGLGNIVNPLTSLADKDVYAVPLLLLIGWRGQPGVHDEPQHVTMGKLTLSLLETLGIPYRILDEHYEPTLHEAVAYLAQAQAPFALVARKGLFQPYKLHTETAVEATLTREQAILTIIASLHPDDIVVSTTGMASRELFELREARHEGHEKDFLTVGSMGHASSLACGIALAKPARHVYCLDGDGALIMHLGALGVIGQLQPRNFSHIVLNNASYDSVGGQPTASPSMHLPQLATAAGYRYASAAASVQDLTVQLAIMRDTPGPGFLEITVKGGHRQDLGRPTTTPQENKRAFAAFVRG